MRLLEKALVLVCVGATLISCGGGGGGSNHGPKLLIDSNQTGSLQLYVQRGDGTGRTVVPLTDLPFVGSMSQAGKVATSLTIAANEDVYIVNANGTNLTRVTTNAGDDFRPIISPDGSRIVFVSLRDGNYEIYGINSDGTNEHRLTNNAAVDYFPAISADGTQVVFVSSRDGNDEIYKINWDGTGLTRLTNDVAADTTPAFSPNGASVIFSSDRVDFPNVQIMRANADGTGVTALTSGASERYHASYSTDGSKIGYYVSSGANRQVFLMNANGTNETNISNNAFSESKTSGWIYP
jgi:Tol biopolymer transport system component